jgi:type III secretion protein R
LLQAVRGPLGDFMMKHSRPAERQFLVTAAKRIDPARDARETDMPLLIPAFLISEISSGFEAGFLLYIAFLVVDLVVANVLTAMGMMMLSPSTVSIPLKLFVFVSVSGMSRLMHGLIVGYAK